ncbi:MAG: aminoglycoside phosphotransferase [Pedosphaera sp.]|nr:aminoglycoside phosphotransferase [Pedosphaera sp.]
MTPAEFRHQHPELFFLDASEFLSLECFLRSLKVLMANETLRAIARAGEGNMNCTMRVTTSSRTLIVKQSRPWVEKYPQFSAPWDRALREREFYEIVATVPSLAGAMPRLLACEREARILVFEDLGTGGDYSGSYRGESFQTEEIDALAKFLSRLHRMFEQAGSHPALPNREMRTLNHAHIFEIPLNRDNGLDLDRLQPGLQSSAEGLRGDAAFCREVRRLGTEMYLVDGPCLLHGDFFPGSFVRTHGGPRVIDPEFCFFGRPEWDAGVFLAHLWLGGQPAALRDQWRRAYHAPTGFDDALMIQLAGVEIMRRLIGYAQLPLSSSLAARKSLLDLSHELVLRPSIALLAEP